MLALLAMWTPLLLLVLPKAIPSCFRELEVLEPGVELLEVAKLSQLVSREDSEHSVVVLVVHTV